MRKISDMITSPNWRLKKAQVDNITSRGSLKYFWNSILMIMKMFRMKMSLEWTAEGCNQRVSILAPKSQWQPMTRSSTQWLLTIRWPDDQWIGIWNSSRLLSPDQVSSVLYPSRLFASILISWHCNFNQENPLSSELVLRPSQTLIRSPFGVFRLRWWWPCYFELMMMVAFLALLFYCLLLWYLLFRFLLFCYLLFRNS